MQSDEKKLIDKKVYGLLIEINNKNLFISVQTAFSLEEAFQLAGKEFQTLNPPRRTGEDLFKGSKIVLFTIKTFEDLAFSNSIPILNIKTEPKNASKEDIQALGKEIDETLKLMGMMFDGPRSIKKPIISTGVRIKEQEKKLPFPMPRLEKPVEKVLTKEEEKNNLMRMIIATKDKKLFEQNKKSLSRAEKAYITKHLI